MGYCECNDNMLSWVKGNDVLLMARVYEKSEQEVTPVGNEPATNETEVVDVPFDLTACDDIMVRCSDGMGKEVNLEFAIAQSEDNCLVLRIPHTLEVCPNWMVEVTCTRNGYHVRSFEVTFAVVETNCEARTTFDVIDGCQSASLRVTLQIVPQAEVRGQNAYEMWKQLPGNESKSLQDYIDEVLDFHTRADQINAAEAQRVLKENERQAMEQNRQEAEVQRQADTQAAVNAANAAATGAERVNATLSGTTLTVTNRNGVSTSVDTKGEPGDDGVGVPSGGSAGQVLSKASGTDYDTQWVNPPAAGVNSVNGKSGDVTLDASDVGALPDDTVIPSEVTEQTVSDWGFTKNTGTYSKPSGGIPSTDLSTDVQTSLGKADTALQSFTESDPTVPSWAKASSKPSYSYSEISNTPDLSGFITNAVDDLVNYYLKSETYTKAEVQGLIDAVKQFTYQVASVLPTASADTMHIIYLVPSSDPQTQNVKDEYITIDNGAEAETRYTWEQIGSTAIDLSGYIQKSNTAGLVKNDGTIDTTQYTTNTGTITGITMNGASKGTSGVVDLGTVITSHQDISGKADKVSSATSGNFAALDANGNLTDSGHKHSDYLTQHQDLSNYVQKSQTAGLLKNDGAVDTNTYLTQHQDISGKQDVIDAQHKLSADLVDDSTATNKFVTASDKQAWNGKQDALTFETTPSSSNKVATMADMPTTMGASGSTHKGGLVPDTPSTAGTTKFLREDGTWSVPDDGIRAVTVESAAAISVNPDVVTVIDGAVGTAAITLQVPNDNLAHVWDILLTTDSTVAITFAMSNSATILYPDGFSVGASTAVEISVIGIGTKYYLRYGEFA